MNVLTDLIESEKISLYCLAKETEISYSTLADIVHDKVKIQNIKFETALKIARYFMVDAECLTYDVLYVDQFKNKYFGRIIEEEGKYHVSFSDYDKKERKDFVALANNDTALFIHEFSQWTMEKCINGQILERWDEFL